MRATRTSRRGGLKIIIPKKFNCSLTPDYPPSRPLDVLPPKGRIKSSTPTAGDMYQARTIKKIPRLGDLIKGCFIKVIHQYHLLPLSTLSRFPKVVWSMCANISLYRHRLLALYSPYFLVNTLLLT